MRRFEDDSGQDWEVVAGRESWGALVAIFVPVDGASGLEMRHSPLDAESWEQAAAGFERMDDAALRALFARSEPKTF